MDWLFGKINNYMVEQQKQSHIKKIRREMAGIKRELNTITQNLNYAISMIQINEGINKISQYNNRYMELYDELKQYSVKNNVCLGAKKWIFK